MVTQHVSHLHFRRQVFCMSLLWAIVALQLRCRRAIVALQQPPLQATMRASNCRVSWIMAWRRRRSWLVIHACGKMRPAEIVACTYIRSDRGRETLFACLILSLGILYHKSSKVTHAQPIQQHTQSVCKAVPCRIVFMETSDQQRQRDQLLCEQPGRACVWPDRTGVCACPLAHVCCRNPLTIASLAIHPNILLRYIYSRQYLRSYLLPYLLVYSFL